MRREGEVEVTFAGVRGGFVNDANIETTEAVRQDAGTYSGSSQE